MIINYSKFNNHWETKTLNDLGTFRRGKSKHRPRNDSALFENGEYPLIQTGEIKDANLYINSHKGSYNEFGLKQSKLWNKGTLCITIAANIAETAILNYPMCFPDSVVGFNAFKDKSSEIFIHYVITYIRKAIQNAASGSIQDNINIDYLTSLKFKIPTKQIQDKIAAILSALDDKIELNNQINTELEAMAKTLYDYWFVQFDFPDENGKPYKSSGGKMVFNEVLKREIPEGWGNMIINDLGSVIGGSTPSKANPQNFCDNGIPWITPKDLSMNIGNKFISNGELDVSALGLKDASLNILPLNSVLMSSRAPIGYLAINRKECTTNQGFKSIVCDKGYASEYVYYVLKNNMKIIEANASGSTFKEISGSVFKSIDIIKPDKEVLSHFREKVAPIFKKQNNLEKQNQELAQLRDWLLPMLMNGQVSVGSGEYENEKGSLGMVAEEKLNY